MTKRSEQWRDVVGYEGLYQVSNLGRVKSLDRVVQRKLGGPARRKGRVLRSMLSGAYLVVGLYKGGIKTTIAVHRVVAAAWIGPCSDGQEVCHGPNGKLDNSVSNLSYGTRSSNILDRRRDGTHCGRPVRCSDGKEYISMKVAAEETGCDVSGIWAVCNGHRKRTGGYGWTYI